MRLRGGRVAVWPLSASTSRPDSRGRHKVSRHGNEARELAMVTFPEHATVVWDKRLRNENGRWVTLGNSNLLTVYECADELRGLNTTDDRAELRNRDGRRFGPRRHSRQCQLIAVDWAGGPGRGGTVPSSSRHPPPVFSLFPLHVPPADLCCNPPPIRLTVASLLRPPAGCGHFPYRHPPKQP